MKLLFGSQNFGYNTSQSDRDWLEFIYPTLDDILANKMTCKEIKNTDGSLTKIRDIRLIIDMVNKCNFTDLQFMYSQEMYDCEDLAWFIENRERLVRSNIEQMFKSNAGCVKTSLKMGSQKDFIRAFAFTGMIERVLYSDEEFMMRVPELSQLRCDSSLMTRKDYLLDKLDEFEKYINLNDFKKDEEIIYLAKEEVKRLLKVHLQKY